MTINQISYEEVAENLQKSMDFLGVEDAFAFFGKSKEEFIFRMEHNVGREDEWYIAKDGRLLMPKLGIY